MARRNGEPGGSGELDALRCAREPNTTRPRQTTTHVVRVSAIPVVLGVLSDAVHDSFALLIGPGCGLLGCRPRHDRWLCICHQDLPTLVTGVSIRLTPYSTGRLRSQAQRLPSRQ